MRATSIYGSPISRTCPGPTVSGRASYRGGPGCKHPSAHISTVRWRERSKGSLGARVWPITNWQPAPCGTQERESLSNESGCGGWIEFLAPALEGFLELPVVQLRVL